MKSEWNAELIAKICDGRILNPGLKEVTGFSTDTRTISSGNVYVALSGENFNGHAFAQMAIKKQAAGLIVSENIEFEENCEAFVVKVNDCLEALQQCAHHYRKNHRGFFIGVTGSNGKTTTRAMLHHLLSEKHRCSATEGNLNNHIGLPLTILSTPEDAEYVVLEMGMNHSGEIRELCRIAKPDAALVSNIGPAHIGILGNLENIAAAKAEIFELLPPDSQAVAPSDNQFYELFRSVAGESLKTFGQTNSPDYLIENIEMTESNTSFNFSYQDMTIKCMLPLIGRHNAFNAAAALALYHSLGFDISSGAKRMQSFAAVNARMEKVVKDGINILLDCYNANPGSTSEAVKYLSICSKPRIAVLGDMKELGDMSLELHRQVGKLVGELGPEVLLTVGTEAEAIAEAAIEAGMRQESVLALNSNEEAAELLKREMKTGATVLFKASRGMHFEKIVRSIWPELAEDLH